MGMGTNFEHTNFSFFRELTSNHNLLMLGTIVCRELLKIRKLLRSEGNYEIVLNSDDVRILQKRHLNALFPLIVTLTDDVTLS